jgi:hypothetical protein
MMEQRLQQHLSYDEMLKALVDVADLTPEQRNHLGQCPQCRQEQARLAERFGRLGRMARELAPSPRGPLRLPAQGRTAGLWRFTPFKAAVLTAAMVLVFAVWWPQHLSRPPVPNPQLSQQRLAADEQLMEQIDALVDDALPADLQHIVAESDSDEDTDDNSLNWIVPLPDDSGDDESLS